MMRLHVEVQLHNKFDVEVTQCMILHDAAGSMRFPRCMLRSMDFSFSWRWQGQSTIPPTR